MSVGAGNGVNKEIIPATGVLTGSSRISRIAEEAMLRS
jgi:hypothetical protein